MVRAGATVTRSKPETSLQARIVEALEDIGFLVIRVHSGTVKVKRGWMHLGPEGFPDLLVVGQRFLEVKTDDGELTLAQRTMHARIRRAGELVSVVRTPAEAIRAVRSGRIREGQA
jgi:hypothetical protein